MNTYYCKCGRVIKKNTTAETTGNRDTAGCEGCPYLLPYGPFKYTEHGYEMDVQGYECRTTKHPVDYNTFVTSLGGPNDKTVVHVESLDLDFLESMTEWVRDTFPEHELSGGFKRENIRGSEYLNGLRVSFYPAQNKKGAAAKQRLYHRFFRPNGTRLDITPEEEKAKILADIEKGKAAAQAAKRENDMERKEYTDAKGYRYRIGEIGELGNADRTRLAVKMLSEKPDAEWRKMPMTPTWPITNEKDAAEALEIMAAEKGWQQTGKAEAQAEGNVEEQEITTFKELGLSDNCIRVLYDMGFEDDDVDILDSLLSEEEERLQRDFPDNWEKIRAYIKKDEHSTDTDDAGKEESSETENPTYSSAATVAGTEVAESPEPVDSEPTTETAVSTDAAREDAVAPIPASPNTPAAFDYSGLSEKTEDTLHWAEGRIRDARRKYITDVAEAVAIVHDELVQNLDEHNNQHSESTFVSWCSYVGISRSTAYNLLQVNALMSGATPEEMAQLEQASPSLLYAAAKPSAPQELVQAVKSGDITTHKDFKALEKQLAEERELRRQAEYGRDCAVKDLHQLERESAEDQQRLEGLLKNADERLAAEKHKSEGLHNLLANRNEQLQKAQSENSMLLDRQGEHIARIKELENRPIDVAVQQPDPEDINRLAAEKAKNMTAMLSAQVEWLKNSLEAAEKDADQSKIIIYNAASQFAQSAAETIDTIGAQFMSLCASLTEDDAVEAAAPMIDAAHRLDDLFLE